MVRGNAKAYEKVEWTLVTAQPREIISAGGAACDAIEGGGMDMRSDPRRGRRAGEMNSTTADSEGGVGSVEEEAALLAWT